MHGLRRQKTSAMYPLFVATAVVLAAGTHHPVVSAGGMQLKHRSSVRVHGGMLLPSIPSTMGIQRFVWGLTPKRMQEAHRVRGEQYHSKFSSDTPPRYGRIYRGDA